MISPAELWLKHPDIDGIEVSSFGRVRSVKGYCYKVSSGNSGYMQVQFYMNGKNVNKLVHRLVAQTFIPNPNNLPQVNHKDGDRKNNNTSNLEWCTNSYNQKYREKYGISNTETRGKPVLAVNLKTQEVYRFQSQREAGRNLEFTVQSINYVIKGRQKQTHGYWFTNDDEKAADAIKRKLEEA